MAVTVTHSRPWRSNQVQKNGLLVNNPFGWGCDKTLGLKDLAIVAQREVGMLIGCCYPRYIHLPFHGVALSVFEWMHHQRTPTMLTQFVLGFSSISQAESTRKQTTQEPVFKNHSQPEGGTGGDELHLFRSPGM